MSYGTVETFKSKKALKERVAEVGAENVGVFGTSMFGDENATTVEELANFRGHVIVGPDVYTKRNWYATAYRKNNGDVVIK